MKQRGDIYIILSSYLNELKAQEERKPPEERQPVPSYRELAESIRACEPAETPEPFTLNRLAKGRVKLLNLETARMVMDEMNRRGFRMDLTDFVRYIPPEKVQ
jgi:hypothetical protein